MRMGLSCPMIVVEINVLDRSSFAVIEPPLNYPSFLVASLSR